MLKPWDHQETHIRTGVACIQFILRMPQFRHTAAIPCMDMHSTYVNLRARPLQLKKSTLMLEPLVQKIDSATWSNEYNKLNVLKLRVALHQRLLTLLDSVRLRRLQGSPPLAMCSWHSSGLLWRGPVANRNDEAASAHCYCCPTMLQRRHMDRGELLGAFVHVWIDHLLQGHDSEHKSRT